MISRSKTIASAPSCEEVARLAYHIYESEGCPDGRALEHWQKAESMLREQRSEQRQRTGRFPFDDVDLPEDVMVL